MIKGSFQFYGVDCHKTLDSLSPLRRATILIKEDPLCA